MTINRIETGRAQLRWQTVLSNTRRAIDNSTPNTTEFAELSRHSCPGKWNLASLDLVLPSDLFSVESCVQQFAQRLVLGLSGGLYNHQYQISRSRRLIEPSGPAGRRVHRNR